MSALAETNARERASWPTHATNAWIPLFFRITRSLRATTQRSALANWAMKERPGQLVGARLLLTAYQRGQALPATARRRGYCTGCAHCCYNHEVRVIFSISRFAAANSAAHTTCLGYTQMSDTTQPSQFPPQDQTEPTTPGQSVGVGDLAPDFALP